MRQRDYPRVIFVGATSWRIRFVRKIPGEGTQTVGLCSHDDETIYILQGLEAIERMKTFAHEVLHAFELEFGLEIDHKLIYALEQPITQFVLDNFFYAKKTRNKTRDQVLKVVSHPGKRANKAKKTPFFLSMRLR